MKTQDDCHWGCCRAQSEQSVATIPLCDRHLREFHEKWTEKHRDLSMRDALRKLLPPWAAVLVHDL